MPSSNGHKVDHASFIDLSDYARQFAIWIALRLKDTNIQVYQVTVFHFLLTIIAAVLLVKGESLNILIASLLILAKNIFDAVDGSLARIRNKPSRVGRFLDSNLDFVGNLFLFLALVNFPLSLRIASFLSFVIQGSFFNFYYILFRNAHKGDTTSKIIEDSKSMYSYDNPSVLRILYFFYKIFYQWQDVLVSFIDRLVRDKNTISPLSASLLSVNGLGFQYLIFIALLLLHQQYFIFIWFIGFMNMYLLIVLISFRFSE